MIKLNNVKAHYKVRIEAENGGILNINVMALNEEDAIFKADEHIVMWNAKVLEVKLIEG